MVMLNQRILQIQGVQGISVIFPTGISWVSAWMDTWPRDVLFLRRAEALKDVQEEFKPLDH